MAENEKGAGASGGAPQFKMGNAGREIKRRIDTVSEAAQLVSSEAAPEGDVSLVASAVLIGLGALIEAELLPGMLIGAAAVLASRWMPDLLGGVVRPTVKTAIKVGYVAVSKTSEVVSEAAKQFQDMLAEARSEHEAAQIAH